MILSWCDGVILRSAAQSVVPRRMAGILSRRPSRPSLRYGASGCRLPIQSQIIALYCNCTFYNFRALLEMRVIVREGGRSSNRGERDENPNQYWILNTPLSRSMTAFVLHLRQKATFGSGYQVRSDVSNLP